MKAIFTHLVQPDGVLLKLQRRRLLSWQPLPVKDWHLADGKQGAAARFLLPGVEAGDSVEREGGIFVPHPLVASLPATVAAMPFVPNHYKR